MDQHKAISNADSVASVGIDKYSYEWEADFDPNILTKQMDVDICKDNWDHLK